MLHGLGVTFISWRIECLFTYLKAITDSRERVMFWVIMGSAVRLGAGANVCSATVLVMANALRLMLMCVLFWGESDDMLYESVQLDFCVPYLLDYGILSHTCSGAKS